MMADAGRMLAGADSEYQVTIVKYGTRPAP